jgi:hypothetical protein
LIFALLLIISSHKLLKTTNFCYLFSNILYPTENDSQKSNCLGGENMIRAFATIGFIMALIGGLILIFLGIAGMLGIFWFIFAPLYSLTAFIWGIVMLVLGIICAGGAKFVSNVPTAILLILLGVIASFLGGWFTAWLIIIGAIFGLLSRL